MACQVEDSVGTPNKLSLFGAPAESCGVVCLGRRNGEYGGSTSEPDIACPLIVVVVERKDLSLSKVLTSRRAHKYPRGNAAIVHPACGIPERSPCC